VRRVFIRRPRNRWFGEGTLPVAAVRVNERTVLVSPDAPMGPPSAGFGLYARVSSHDQKSDLDRPVARLKAGLLRRAGRWCGWRPRSGPG
jgi:putative resolvase